MKKIYSLMVVVLMGMNAMAQLAYNQTFSQSDWNNSSTKVASNGNNAWDSGIRLGKTSGSGFNWNDKYIVIALSNAKVPYHLTCNTSTSSSAATSVSFKIYTSTDNSTFTEQWSSSSKSNSVDIELPKATKYIKVQYSGNFAGYYKNLKVTNLTYERSATPASLDFGSAELASAKSTMTTTVEWCDIPAMTYSVTGDDAAQFAVSVANNSSAVHWGTATYTVSYKHDQVGTHSATLNINSQTVTLAGTTTRKSQAIAWAEEWADAQPPVLVGTTITNAANATSTLPVTYTSSDETIIAVINNGQALQALQEGDAVITAQQTGDAEWAEAASISKTFTVYNKFTPSFSLSNAPEQTEADLKVGESIAINIENTTEALQSEYNTDYLSIVSGEGIITVTAMGATESTTLTLTQPETATIFSASRTFTFHITKNTATLTNNLAAEYLVDDEIAFADLYTATNDEVAVTVLSSDETVLKADGDKLVAVGAGTAEITVAQAENYKWTALSDTKTVTVSKHANTIIWSFAGVNDNSKTLSYDETVAVACTSDNTDTENSPITIVQTAGEDIATYNIEQQTVTASYHNGTATWTVSQPEDRKYLAAEATITVTVAPMTANCYAVEDPDSHSIGWYSNSDGIEYTLNGIGETFSIDVWKENAATDAITIYGYNSSNSESKLAEYSSGSLSSSASTKTLTLSEDIVKIKVKAGGTLNKHFRNLYITRKQVLTPSETSITLPTNEIGGQTTATFALTWSTCADEIHIVSDNPHFTLDKTAIPTNGGAGTANITVTYSSDEIEENATCTLAIYTPYQQATVVISGTTEKKSQMIDWAIGDTILTTDNIQLDATAKTAVTYTNNSEDVAILNVDNTLTILRAGVLHLTAVAEESEEYKSAILNKDIVVVRAMPVVVEMPTLSSITYGQALAEAVLSGGSADVEGTFVVTDDVQQVLSGGEHRVAVQFVPSNADWYQAVDTALTIVVNKAEQEIVWDTDILPNAINVGSILMLDATATSGLAVAYELDDEALVTIEDDVLTAKNVGLLTITARQDGDDNYLAATPVVYVVQITQTITTNTESVPTTIPISKQIIDGQLYIIRGKHIYRVEGTLIQ